MKVKQRSSSANRHEVFSQIQEKDTYDSSVMIFRDQPKAGKEHISWDRSHFILFYEIVVTIHSGTETRVLHCERIATNVLVRPHENPSGTF